MKYIEIITNHGIILEVMRFQGGFSKMADNFKVNLSLNETVKKIDDGIVSGSVTGERVDYYIATGNEDKGVIVLVYEKHYMRAGNRLTLTVCVDNLNEVTRVHAIVSGGGEGLFRVDWGASATFTEVPRKVLNPYIIQ